MKKLKEKNALNPDFYNENHRPVKDIFEED
jgi:hypothetical protein